IDWYPRLILETQMQDAWMHAPVSFEICWVLWHWQRQGWDVDYIIEQSLKWHLSSFNAKSSAVPPQMREKVDLWCKKMGYRLALRRFTYPGELPAGGQFDYTCWWENRGVAPCYKPFRFALRIQGEAASQVFVAEDRIIKWLPGDSLCDGSFALDGTLPPGEYAVQAAILARESETPAVKLAMEGLQPDGWYSLGKLKIL
ncbi:MAG TPA: DUF4832 domain-containing protein, partial [Clostridia bacterium]|nr:DUF4832 domain-containing protein [Clostridia bacterium]